MTKIIALFDGGHLSLLFISSCKGWHISICGHITDQLKSRRLLSKSSEKVVFRDEALQELQSIVTGSSLPSTYSNLLTLSYETSQFQHASVHIVLFGLHKFPPNRYHIHWRSIQSRSVSEGVGTRTHVLVADSSFYSWWGWTFINGICYF